MQPEMFTQESGKPYQISCDCMDDEDRVVVVMQRSLDPKYFRGQCKKCDKIWVEKVGEA